ncbi:hypothetical protein B0H16DRAFT_1572488 [Mycena metata]|uniref:Uncharacterized protein n=1 Tax=Mycena metata TaxID=1033252 RepID=A0AAD7I7W2_9AGAR|nr:hypothetical protein B0H16DRAFT_1572488 [Mycena metata]
MPSSSSVLPTSPNLLPTAQTSVNPTVVSEGRLSSAPSHPTSLSPDEPVRPTSDDDEVPVLPTPDNGSPVSTTTPEATAFLRVSQRKSPPKATIVGTVIGGILGVGGIIAFASLANWLHKIRQAKKAKKPGSFKSKGHEFNFVVPPPYVPGNPRKESPQSYQITLTLTPVDIEEGYAYQEVVWQRFLVTQTDISKTRRFTAKLDYDRAFGTANIRTGGDAINGVAFSDQPNCFEYAKPGRPIPFRGYAWANSLQFIARKYTRIMARNEGHVPLRLVIGSYVREEDQREFDYRTLEEGKQSEIWDSGTTEAAAAFQSFVVMDDKIGYGEQVSASLDLILRVYKTQDVEVGQILSPTYVRHKAVPLLGEGGIRLSKLPRIATWLVDTEGSDVRLKMQAPGVWQYLSQYL